MSWYPIDGVISLVRGIVEQRPPDMSETTCSSWQWDTCRQLFNIPSWHQESRISIGLSQGLDLREVMSWYTVGRVAFTAGAIAQQDPWSIDACYWWHWDPGGFVDDRFSQRLVRDLSIKGSVFGGLI